MSDVATDEIVQTDWSSLTLGEQIRHFEVEGYLVSPFCVVPRSHRSFHNDGNPYRRYARHPEQVMVTAQAGSAALINQNVFHGNYPNVGDRPRELLAIAYRPAWAGLGGEVSPWDAEELAKVPDSVSALMTDRNQRVWMSQGGNKPEGMQDSADGIAPSRWERME